MANNSSGRAAPPNPLFQQALTLQRQGRLDEARQICTTILKRAPQHFETLSLLGLIAGRAGDFTAAVDFLGQAIAVNPKVASTHSNRGTALLKLNRPDEALVCLDAALALEPSLVEAHNNRGNALLDLDRPDDAVASYDRALALRPDYANAHANRGNALLELRRPRDAMASYDRAVAIQPDHADAWAHRGIALLELNVPDEALASYERALTLAPDSGSHHVSRAGTLLQLKRPADALASYERALALDPAQEFLLGSILDTRMRLCEWTGLTEKVAKLKAEILASRNVAAPPLALTDDPEIHLRAARTFAESRYPAISRLGAIPLRPKRDRIRIGYYSTDFYDHAVARLIAGLFEAHDATRFEIVGFAFGPDTQDEVRNRISAAFDTFLDVRGHSNVAIAALSRDHGIDIAVDLNGHTHGARTGIFAARAAPIQVNFLGYPGTIGADYIDYIVADEIVIPGDRRDDFIEKVVYLPHSYQANDSRREISARTFTRAEFGLPETGFVFCCFNAAYKILPDTFETWMNLLKAIDGSVLWLLDDNAIAVANLRKEADARGVDAARLVFAGRLPAAEHLARHRLADLFLDTLPYNAHTTASDALWAGLPVLTCAGTSFAARVGASLLYALDLPELVTTSRAAYEAAALALATDSAKLRTIKRKLAENRLTKPLFDTALYARHIEAAYTTMYERYLAGLPVESFKVA